MLYPPGGQESIGNLSETGLKSFAWDNTHLYSISDDDNSLYIILRRDDEIDGIDEGYTSRVGLEGSLGNGSWCSLAWDGTTLYAIDNNTNTLYTIDKTDGTKAKVGEEGALGSGDWQSLTWDGNTLFTIDDKTDSLYSVNKTNGDTTRVGKIGSLGKGDWQSLTWDGANLYAINNADDTIHIINTVYRESSQVLLDMLHCEYEPIIINRSVTPNTSRPATDAEARDKIKKFLEDINTEDFFFDETYRSFWLMPFLFDTGNRLLQYSATNH